MKKKINETFISFGSAVKAMGNGVIGGHLVLYGDPDNKDFDRQYFTKNTYFGPSDGDGQLTAINHMIAVKTGDPAIDQQLKDLSKRRLPSLKTKRDALGIFAEVMLNLSDEYEKLVYDLAQKGVWKFSAGSAPHLLDVAEDGWIKQFPIAEGSLTPIPAEPRMLDHRVMPLKAYLEILNQPDDESGTGAEGDGSGGPASRKSAGITKHGVKTMDILEAIKQLVPGMTDEQLQQITAILGLTGMTVPAGEMTDEVAADVEAGKSISMVSLINQLKSVGYEINLPGQKSMKIAAKRPAFEHNPDPIQSAKPDPEKEKAEKAVKSLNAVYLKKFGQADSAQDQILADVIGADYKQVLYDQDLAYQKFIRFGDRMLEGREINLLKRQIYPLKSIIDMAGGLSLGAIKTTMVEAAGELGGFAVPAQRQDRIISRLPGMTAVRGAGAEVITLQNSNSVELLIWAGGDDQYTGNIRGQWGSETQTPSEQNGKFALQPVVAHIYTYKVGVSQSLLEDAVNAVNKVENDIGDVLAIDEDITFLIGDGVAKPLGILPGGINELSLTEKVSLAAAAVTAAGIKALKRGVASQYRKNAVWVANSDTYGDIEALVATDGKFIFEDLSDDERLLNRKIYESEALADVAASAYPIIFGDMSGYAIVERLGLAIERFHDSNTGINKVEFHVRRRVGGRVTQPWKFAVQKIAAS
jgi:HK97 family phage major capsid protein